MSASSSGALQMVSNGKRFRLQWQAGDGDGNPNARLIKRSRNLLKSHPTWKVFLGDIPLPIIRGTQHEPPDYVYLDDHACYTIHPSRAHGRDELSPFWSFDYDYRGNIKTGRKNRGRPAYLAASCTAYAKAPLRGKDKWYEFAGAPEAVEYRPLRLKKETRMEQEVEAEIKEQPLNRNKADCSACGLLSLILLLEPSTIS